MRGVLLVVAALALAGPVRAAAPVLTQGLGGSRTARVVPAAGTYPSYPSGFAVRNGVAWFSATDGTNGASLWRTNGTEAGTTMLDAGIDPFGMTWAGSKLFFTAHDPSFGEELFVSNGSAGTVPASSSCV